MKAGTISGLILAAALIAYCQADQQDLKAVTNGNNLFSTQLYDAIRKSSNQNLIVSPISVSTAMAMLQAGAKGKTAQEIKSSLKFPESDEQLNKGYQSLLEQLRSDDSVTLEMANKIFPKTGFKLNPPFADALKTYFSAEPEQLNFAQSAESAQRINRFVENATRDRIKDLISADDLNDMTRLVLVNAIYFKGTWKNQFPKEDTTQMDFFTSETDSVKVDMMRLETDMLYGEIKELDAKVVSLPYKGDRLSMIILLPNSRTGLVAMEEKLKTFPLQSIIENLRERKVQLFLPKFKLESTIDLKEPLTKLGLSSIFAAGQPDFSGIPDPSNKEELFVSKAIQKAFIEVNEEGSEAAAATGTIVQSRSGFSLSDEFIVDHGFAAIIYHRPTHVPLFMSAVEDATIHQTMSRSLTAAGGVGKVVATASLTTFLLSTVLVKFMSGLIFH